MTFPRRLFFWCSCILILGSVASLGNGGAWQVGVPLTGNGAASDKGKSTNIAIEEESLTIDLHQEFAAVEVRYRMKNTGPAVAQDFFFPVERWTPEEGAEEHDMPVSKTADLEDYGIMADKTELKSKTIDLKPVATPTPSPTPEKAESEDQKEDAKAPESSGNAEGEETEADPDVRRYTDNWDFPPPTKHWKKSEIPFAANQTREVTIRYRVGYSSQESSVSDDAHGSNREFIYSLSPAATWKGAIGKGKVTVNVLHPLPEEVSIEKPKDQFKKVSETRYEWSFSNLEPTLADDLKVVAHRAYDSYDATQHGPETEGEEQVQASYLIQGDRYFLQHRDYNATASSTLAPAGKHNYDVKNLKGLEADLAWVEGAKDDGIGESVTLDVKRPLPLDAILIMPGYRSGESPSLWEKNNRVAELEVTLNGEHTFTAKIPDEKFEDLYPIPVRDYATPVKAVKLVIKAVHRGTAAHDTCISAVELRGKLAKKPEFHPAR